MRLACNLSFLQFSWLGCVVSAPVDARPPDSVPGLSAHCEDAAGWRALTFPGAQGTRPRLRLPRLPGIPGPRDPRPGSRETPPPDLKASPSRDPPPRGFGAHLITPPNPDIPRSSDTPRSPRPPEILKPRPLEPSERDSRTSGRANRTPLLYPAGTKPPRCPPPRGPPPTPHA